MHLRQATALVNDNASRGSRQRRHLHLRKTLALGKKTCTWEKILAPGKTFAPGAPMKTLALGKTLAPGATGKKYLQQGETVGQGK